MENKLSGVQPGIVKAKPESGAEERLSDSELGRLINLSSSLIYHYRIEGKAHQGVVERLKDWEVIGDRAREKERAMNLLFL